MRKYYVCGHELEFDEELVEEFEREVCDSFIESAKCHLTSNFREPDLTKVFQTHSLEDIKNMIVFTAKQEIALYKGEI